MKPLEGGEKDTVGARLMPVKGSVQMHCKQVGGHRLLVLGRWGARRVPGGAATAQGALLLGDCSEQ